MLCCESCSPSAQRLGGGPIELHNFRARVFARIVRKALGRGRRFTPHGKVMRYDTAADVSVFVLKYEECGHNGGLGASLPGPTFTVSTDKGTFSVRSNRPLTPGRHHIAGVYDGKHVTLYVDGEHVGEDEARGQVSTGSGTVGIGRLAEGSARFRGQVVQVRISDTARSEAWMETACEGMGDR